MKYLKYIVIIWAIILISILLLPIACADPSIIIYNYELYPSVFMPGDSGILKLTVKNAEPTNSVAKTSTSSSTGQVYIVYTDTVGATINNIWLLPASDGNKQIKATLNYEDVGYLAPGAGFDINFKIVAEEGITEGLYLLTACIDVETYQDVNFPIPINVDNASVDLIPTEISSKIPMCGSTDITLTAVNNRRTSVDGVTVTPKAIDGVEFIPSSVFIGTMNSGASKDVSFSLNPTETGSKNLSFNISYMNGDNPHKRTLVIPVEFIETLDVAPIFISIPSSIEKGESPKIRLEVFNAKTSKITGVIVTPITDAEIFPSQYFIGSMEPDDAFSASFDINTDDLDIGNYTIGFKVSFKQGANYYETPAVNASFGVVAATDGGGDINLGAIIGGILVIVITFSLFFIWKKRRIIKCLRT